MTTQVALVLPERIEASILVIRGQRVLLDADLARLYEVETRVLVQAVKRNTDRFPEDFMFQLTKEEHDSLRSQSVTSSWSEGVEEPNLRSQSVTSNGYGGRRSLPYAFTEQGVAMLSSVLRSDRAVHVNIEIMRAFVRLRRMLLSYDDLALKLEELEQRYDAQFAAVFDAIRELMAPPDAPARRIGFITGN